MTEKTVIKRTGLARLFYTLVHSFNGLKWLAKKEAAFQQELLLFIPLTGVAFWLDLPAYETLFLIVSMLFVLFTEMANTAIEAVVDRVGLEYHELSGVAKNIGSAMVTLSLLIWLSVWAVVLYQHYYG